MSTLEEPRTYTNFRRPKSYVLGSLGLIASIAVIVLCITFALIMFFVGLAPAFIFAALFTPLVMMLSIKDRHGRSHLETLAGHLTWAKAKVKGENIYRSGITGAGQVAELPGLLARTEVFPCVDSTLVPFGLLHHGRSNDYTVVLRANPNGYILTDGFDLETTVDRWNKWLVRAAHEPGLRQVQVTVETRPDHGQALRREISLHKSPFAPPAAAEIMDDIKNTYPSGSARVSTYLSMTFSGSTRKGNKRGTAAIAKQLASRLPALTKDLPSTGAGPCKPLDEHELAMLVRQAYNPSDADTVAEAEALGQPGRELLTTWRACGPRAWEEHWDHLRHDSGVSVTWVVSNVSGEMLATSIQPLLQPHEDVPVKRVSLIYHPKSPDQSALMVERDKRNADHRVNSAHVASSRAETEQGAAHAVAKAEARGAALVDFAVMVTATVKDTRDPADPDKTLEAKVEDAVAAVDTLAPAVRFTHRLDYGAQATGFALNLPLGIVAADHSAVPATIREGL